jgi:flagella basal body P-ring formation protein FlgA
VINAGMVRQIKPEILVRRNKHVAVVISRPGLAITAIGRALEDGHVGEYIKVQMRITDSSRTIIARVNNDGTVEPVL